jgi:hypothetical protein
MCDVRCLDLLDRLAVLVDEGAELVGGAALGALGEFPQGLRVLIGAGLHSPLSFRFQLRLQRPFDRDDLGRREVFPIGILAPFAPHDVVEVDDMDGRLSRRRRPGPLG